MLKAVVFDFDGVIVDSEPLHYAALVEVIRPMDIELSYDDYLARYIGFDDRDCFRTALYERSGVKPPPESPQIDQLIHQKMLAFERVVEGGISAMPGAVALVRDLAATIPLAIASGASRADIELVCKALAIGSCFALTVSADDVRQSKPDPETYAKAVDQLAARYPGHDLKPEHCLAIEDTTQGLLSARGAGLMTLGVTTMLPAEALATSADRVVPTLQGIDAATLREWFGSR